MKEPTFTLKGGHKLSPIILRSLASLTGAASDLGTAALAAAEQMDAFQKAEREARREAKAEAEAEEKAAAAEEAAPADGD